MNRSQRQDAAAVAGVDRRRLLAGAALAPVLAGIGPAAAHGGPAGDSGKDTAKPVEPVPTTQADWQQVARILGRPGNMMRGMYYHTPFPRGDLHVVSHGITVTPGLALGSHVSFVRYADGSTLAMGDLVVTEDDLQKMTDALHARGFTQTAIHKHLLAQTPDVWWTHIHSAGHDPAALARNLRAVLDHTGTPPATPPAPSPSIDLDTSGIDAALGARGTGNGGIYTCTFIRRETITDMGRALPPGLASTTAFNFQPLGDGRAALSGDFVMIADEVQDALKALRRGGIDVVSLHNHGLTDEPRLFFTHIWAVDDAVGLARALRAAVAVTNSKPAA